MGIGNDFPFRCGAKPDSTLPACLQIKVEMGILKFTSNGIRFLIAIRKLRTAAWHCRILAFLLPPSPKTPIWRKNMEQTWNAPELLQTKETTRKYCFWWLRGIFLLRQFFWQTFFRVEFCLYGGCWLKVYLCWSGWDLWSKWTLIDMGIRFFLLTFKSKNMQFDTQSKLTTIIQWNVSHISLFLPIGVSCSWDQNINHVKSLSS